MVADRELASFLSGSSLDEMADNLVQLVLERGAPDNVTLILVLNHDA